MTCPLATGACTLSSDGACITPKEYDSNLVPLTDIYIDGNDDSFSITWNTAVSYAGQNVKALFRLSGLVGNYLPRQSAVRDTGSLNSESGLPKGGLYGVWLRPETATTYGDWQYIEAITDNGWNSESEVVEYLGETVFYGEDVVLYS